MCTGNGVRVKQKLRPILKGRTDGPNWGPRTMVRGLIKYSRNDSEQESHRNSPVRQSMVSNWITSFVLAAARPHSYLALRLTPRRDSQSPNHNSPTARCIRDGVHVKHKMKKSSRNPELTSVARQSVGSHQMEGRHINKSGYDDRCGGRD
jgi:hypothetical protein